MNNLVKIAICGTIMGFSCGIILGYIPVQVQFLKNVLQDGTKIANCANCDMRGVVDLLGIDAHGLHAPGINFQPCMPSLSNKNNGFMICIPKQVSNLTGVNFAYANFFSSCFDFTILDKADLTGVDLSSSSVQYASLKDAIVKNMITKNATFCNSIMPDGKICKDTWTGQGITITCNCTEQSKALPQSLDSFKK